MRLFQLHSEQKIGLKKLSLAELGMSKSHQTHIGLLSETLTFFADHVPEFLGFLFLQHKYYIGEIGFDRITNPNGSTRSPKLRQGSGRHSLIKEIRRLAQTQPEEEWILIWFGTKTKILLTVLLTQADQLYIKIRQAGLGLTATSQRRVISTSNQVAMFEDLLHKHIRTLLNSELERILGKIIAKKPLFEEELFINEAFRLDNRISKITANIEQQLRVIFEDRKNKGEIIYYRIDPYSPISPCTLHCFIKKSNGSSHRILVKTAEFDIDYPIIFYYEDFQFLFLKPENTKTSLYKFTYITEEKCRLDTIHSLSKLLAGYFSEQNINLFELLSPSSPIVDLTVKLPCSIVKDWISF